jgi:uncharacterized tellurite resistance protein B-like protein
MSNEQQQPEADSAAILDILGPPPAEPDAAAAPTLVLETILLRVLARVIHADGTIHPKEMSALVQIAVELGLGGEEARKILDDELNQKSDVGVLAAQLPDEQHRREAYAMACVMCCADGEAAEIERAVLHQFADGAGMTREDADNVLATLTDAMATARTSEA